MSIYEFWSTCEDSNAHGQYGDFINEMVQSIHANDIDSKVFFKEIAVKHGFIENLPQLFNHSTVNAAIKDWALSCYESRYQGFHCYYVKQSGIEHIFIDTRYIPELFSGELTERRLAVMDNLSTQMHEDPQWDNATTVEEERAFLVDFIHRNYQALTDNRILISSLFSYKVSDEFANMLMSLDRNYFLCPSAWEHTVTLTLSSDVPEMFPLSSDTIRQDVLAEIMQVLKTHPQEALGLSDTHILGEPVLLGSNSIQFKITACEWNKDLKRNLDAAFAFEGIDLVKVTTEIKTDVIPNISETPRQVQNQSLDDTPAGLRLKM